MTKHIARIKNLPSNLDEKDLRNLLACKVKGRVVRKVTLKDSKRVPGTMKATIVMSKKRHALSVVDALHELQWHERELKAKYIAERDSLNSDISEQQRLENVELFAPSTIQRTEFYQRILNALSHTHGGSNVVLVRSPPFSGKTAAATLLAAHAREHQLYDKIYEFSMLLNRGNIARAFQKQCDAPLYEILTGKATDYTSLVILDEVQVSYAVASADNTEFWNALKYLYGRDKYNGTKVVLIAAYGGAMTRVQWGTPLEIATSHTFGPTDLALSAGEFKSVVEWFNHRYNSTAVAGVRVCVTDRVAALLYDVTAGHIGITMRMLTYLSDIFTRDKSMTPSHALTEDQIIAFMRGKAMYLHVSQCRAVDKSWVLNKLCREVVEKVAMNASVPYSHIDLRHTDSCDVLIKSGVVACDRTENISFASPFLRTIFMQYLYAPLDDAAVSYQFDEFIRMSIINMAHNALKNSLSVGVDGKLLEAQLQCCWQRAAEPLLPVGAHICPSVGKLYGSAGYIDFYIGEPFCYGIELLRDNNRLSEHRERFERDGLYGAHIPFNQFCLINFVQLEMLPDALQVSNVFGKTPLVDKEVRVVYTSTADAFLLLRAGAGGVEVEKLAFLGPIKHAANELVTEVRI